MDPDVDAGGNMQDKQAHIQCAAHQKAAQENLPGTDLPGELWYYTHTDQAHRHTDHGTDAHQRQRSQYIGIHIGAQSTGDAHENTGEQAVEAQGGTVHATSHPGQGMSITFTLPLAPGSEEKK
jgi:hypothetical protein